MVKNLPANAGNAGDTGSIPGSEGSLVVGNSNPYQYSCLKNSMDIRTKTSELLEENIEGKFFDIGLSDEFLDLKPKIKTTKLKTSK